MNFLLFSNCKLTTGPTQSVIADLQLQTYSTISNDFAAILNSLKNEAIDEFCVRTELDRALLLKELDKLVEIGLGHFCDEPDLFPEILDEFISPFDIQDAIIELSSINYAHANKLISELTVLGCQSLELRSYDSETFKDLQIFIDLLPEGRVRSLEIVMKFDKSISLETYKNFLGENPIINKLYLHSSPLPCTEDNDWRIIFVVDEIDSAKCCGKISLNSFVVHLEFYLESRKHNNCLNRKVSIDKEGEIKNCPSQTKSFGNIKTHSLLQIVHLGDFTKLWGISKDKIEICNFCEYRDICSDCRIYIEEPSNIMSKPLKCGYDPIEGKWDDWSSNNKKAKAIKFFDLK